MKFFSFRKKKAIEAQDRSTLFANKGNAGKGVDDQKRRAFLKKGLWGAVGIGGFAALSKMGSAASGIAVGGRRFQSSLKFNQVLARQKKFIRQFSQFNARNFRY